MFRAPRLHMYTRIHMCTYTLIYKYIQNSDGPDIRIRIYFRIRTRKWLLIHIRIRIGKIYGCGYLIEEHKIYRILLYEGEICII